MSLLTEFKNHVVNFLDELIDQFPNESDLVIGRVFLNNQISPEIVMNTFIREVLPYKQGIKDRDESLFLEGKMNFFNDLDKSKVNHFKRIWKSAALDNNDRDIIWKWFDLFVYFAERYKQSKS